MKLFKRKQKLMPKQEDVTFRAESGAVLETWNENFHRYCCRFHHQLI